VADELADRGHTVETWGPEQPMPIGTFDFGIIANVLDTGKVMSQCAKFISVSHGIIPAERPYKGECSKVVYTSEEVRDHWGVEGTVIRQPINLDFWKPSRSHKRKYLTRFSYRAGLPFVPKIAEAMKLRYIHVRSDKPGHVRETLRQSFCVLATGRAALESMACGVPTVICDHRSAYQAPLLDLHPGRSRVRNYSGRGGIIPTFNNVTGAINAAISRGDMRHHVEKHHDAKDITDQLLGAM